MSNLKFPRTGKPRLRPETFTKLVGQWIPEKSDTDCGAIGKHIDELVKTALKAGPSTGTNQPDLETFGVEIKSKDMDSDSYWSIGSMSLDEIMKCSYRESSIYNKMQALLLVSYNTELSEVREVGLYYWDNDEVQSKLEEAYEESRAKLIATYQMRKNQYLDRNQRVIIFEEPKVTFDNFESFRSKYGFFEYKNQGLSFQFRIPNASMKQLCKMAATTETREKFFEEV